MPTNHLEELAAEWYEYQGYYIRRNVRVGRRSKGGHEGELDVVGFKPASGREPATLLHVETSMDTDSWSTRENRFTRKFATGDRYIHALFEGLASPGTRIEKVALLGLASRAKHTTVGGARIVLLGDFLIEVICELKKHSWWTQAVPENYPMLRTLQIVSAYGNKLAPLLDAAEP